MVICRGLTQKGGKCKKSCSGRSKYCKLHQKGGKSKKKVKKIIKKKVKSTTVKRRNQKGGIGTGIVDVDTSIGKYLNPTDLENVTKAFPATQGKIQQKNLNTQDFPHRSLFEKISKISFTRGEINEIVKNLPYIIKNKYATSMLDANDNESLNETIKRKQNIYKIYLRSTDNVFSAGKKPVNELRAMFIIYVNICLLYEEQMRKQKTYKIRDFHERYDDYFDFYEEQVGRIEDTNNSIIPEKIRTELVNYYKSFLSKIIKL